MSNDDWLPEILTSNKLYVPRCCGACLYREIKSVRLKFLLQQEKKSCPVARIESIASHPPRQIE